MSKFDVFIAHSAQDSAWTSRLATSLRKQGVDVWLDVDIPAGADWRKELTKGLSRSSHVVTVVDPQQTTQATPYFQAGAAIGMGKGVTFVVPPGKSGLASDLRGARFVRRQTPEATARQIIRGLKGRSSASSE